MQNRKFIIQWMAVCPLEIKKIYRPCCNRRESAVKAIAYDPASGKSSPVTNEKFDIPRKNWKLVGIEDEKANAILDGDPSTAWHQSKDKKMPVDLVIDLGKEETLSRLQILARPEHMGPGIISQLPVLYFRR